MIKSMAKQYKVGEFAQNLGVSTGFLKHHERYGLLAPQVSESGYRYYRVSDGMQVLNCLKLQGMGFTSKEISDILCNSAEQDIPALLHERREALERQLRLQQETLDYVRWMERLLRDIEEAGGELYTIERGIPFYYVENLHEGDFISDPQLHEVAARWNEVMPLVDHCSVIQGTALNMDGVHADSYNMGLCVRADVGERLSLFLNDKVRLITPGRCLIYRYHGLRHRNLGARQNSLDRMLARPLEICRAHNLSITGDAYIIKMFSSLVHDENKVSETVILPLK